MTKQELVKLAIDETKKSYSPYSNCRVGAALSCANGKIFTGCNIENGAYSPSICAERTAIFKAVSEGEREFSMIAIAGMQDGILQEKFVPCGVCRQVMSEFCDTDFIILVATKEGYQQYSLGELLPHSFAL